MQIQTQSTCTIRISMSMSHIVNTISMDWVQGIRVVWMDLYHLPCGSNFIHNICLSSRPSHLCASYHLQFQSRVHTVLTCVAFMSVVVWKLTWAFVIPLKSVCCELCNTIDRLLVSVQFYWKFQFGFSPLCIFKSC